MVKSCRTQLTRDDVKRSFGLGQVSNTGTEHIYSRHRRPRITGFVMLRGDLFFMGKAEAALLAIEAFGGEIF